MHMLDEGCVRLSSVRAAIISSQPTDFKLCLVEVRS